MNSLFENRNAWLTSDSNSPTPLHMVCPNCPNTWAGRVIHATNCPTPTWVYNSRVDKCVGHHTCGA